MLIRLNPHAYLPRNILRRFVRAALCNGADIPYYRWHCQPYGAMAEAYRVHPGGRYRLHHRGRRSRPEGVSYNLRTYTNLKKKYHETDTKTDIIIVITTER